MLIPILPFKLIGFTECIHMIAFLEDDFYDAIEFMKYTSSISGEGIELILTDKSNRQVIFANNPLNFSNIKNSGREVYQSNTELKIDEKNSLINFELLCNSKIHNIRINFESLFPTSDIHSGKIDPKRHNNNGMPFMYSNNNTVGRKTDIYIDGRKIRVKYSDDPMLNEFKGLQSYFSKNFNLAVISAQDGEIQYNNKRENDIYYKTKRNDIISYSINGLKGIMKYSNYVDVFRYEFNLLENGNLNTINLFYNENNTIQLRFEYLHQSVHDLKGNLYIKFMHCSIEFCCKFSCIITVKGKTTDCNIIHNIFIICHQNAQWEEQQRVLEIQTLYEVQTTDGLIKNVKVDKVSIST